MVGEGNEDGFYGSDEAKSDLVGHFTRIAIKNPVVGEREKEGPC